MEAFPSWNHLGSDFLGPQGPDVGLGAHQGRGTCIKGNPGGLCDPLALSAGLEATPNIQSQCSGSSWKILANAAVTHCPEYSWGQRGRICGQNFWHNKVALSCSWGRGSQQLLLESPISAQRHQGEAGREWCHGSTHSGS